MAGRRDIDEKTLEKKRTRNKKLKLASGPQMADLKKKQKNTYIDNTKLNGDISFKFMCKMSSFSFYFLFFSFLSSRSRISIQPTYFSTFTCIFFIYLRFPLIFFLINRWYNLLQLSSIFSYFSMYSEVGNYTAIHNAN